ELLNWNGVLAYNLERMVQIPCDELNAAFLDTLIIQHDIKKERLANTKRFQRCRSSSKLLEMAICEDKKSYWIKIKRIEPTTHYVQMGDIETDTHYFSLGGVKTHNCRTFDVPYLVNRITRLCSEYDARRLSPWG